MSCMSAEQKRQIEEARRESEEKSYNVGADGRKSTEKYDESSNKINNE